MTRAVVHYWPPFARVPYIDGHRCRRPQGLEAIRFYYSHYVSLLKKRILKETQKVEYDHAAWLRLLMQDAEFRESIVSQHDWFPTLISHGAFGKLLSLGEAGQLSRSNFDFLWKLLSLKLTLSFRQ